MAGGNASVFRSKEGAEDRGRDAMKIIRRRARKNDVVVGIAASGVTAFVRDGLKTAKAIGARTILVTCHPKISKSAADAVIAVNTGPEVIAGSTRLKAGTATKLVLNSLTDQAPPLTKNSKRPYPVGHAKLTGVPTASSNDDSVRSRFLRFDGRASVDPQNPFHRDGRGHLVVDVKEGIGVSEEHFIHTDVAK
jgi:hypothetical protein